MILLQRYDIICPLFRESLGDLFLTSHRINRHDGSVEVSQREECGNGRHCIGLLFDLALSSHQTVGTRPGTHQRDRRGGGGPINGVAEGFPVTGHHLTPGGSAEGLGPCDEAAGQLVRVSL
jgi:hypothetical protein